MTPHARKRTYDKTAGAQIFLTRFSGGFAALIVLSCAIACASAHNTPFMVSA
jgi:hypothetical protein